jgi:hypothetical protein
LRDAAGPLAVFSALYLLLSLATFRHYGISPDEPDVVNRANSFNTAWMEGPATLDTPRNGVWTARPIPARWIPGGTRICLTVT